jgi:hypothetical protein
MEDYDACSCDLCTVTTVGAPGAAPYPPRMDPVGRSCREARGDEEDTSANRQYRGAEIGRRHRTKRQRVVPRSRCCRERSPKTQSTRARDLDTLHTYRKLMLRATDTGQKPDEKGGCYDAKLLTADICVRTKGERKRRQ